MGLVDCGIFDYENKKMNKEQTIDFIRYSKFL